MELTLDQALQKGIEAHKAGRAQEADRYYTAIIKANPKHPDANHNMGVLAVGFGKVETALPFFKTALEANPNIAQFWLSYIDALIKLERIADAKAVFNQAKSAGVKGNDFDKLKEQFKQMPLVDNFKTKNGFHKALQFKDIGKYREAITLLTDYVSHFPEDQSLLALLAHCHILNDDTQAAQKVLSRAKEIEPEIAMVGWNEVRLLLKKQNVVDALEVAKNLHKKFPDDVEGLGVLGACLRANGDLDKSLEILNQAISKEPNYTEAYINRGLVQLSQNNKSKALSDLEKAHQIKPHLKEIWDLIISLYAEEKRYEEAIFLLVKMIEIDPSRQKSLALLAQFNQKADNTEIAIASFEKVLEVIPHDPNLYLNLGVALSAQGANEKAIKNFKKALSINPNFAEAYYSLGNALHKKNKLEEAIEAYTKALSLKPNYIEAYNNMGITLKDQGKLEEAIEAYNKTLSIQPDYVDAYNNMGITLKEQGKLKEAIKVYKKAISIDPDYAEAHYSFGNALQEQGKIKEAIEVYTKVLAINPNHAYAHRNLSSIKKYTIDDSHFLQVQECFGKEDLSKDGECNLRFALANIYEDLGELDQAFKYLSEGNTLRKQLLNYSIDQDLYLFKKLKSVQQAFLQNSLEISRASPNIIPIFIVGMPRSGTTLAEQIISSHSRITGAGELKYVEKFGLSLATGYSTIDLASISKFRSKYLAYLSKVANGKKIVTDKMPQNFRFIPLISAALPEAKFVHLQRNAAATCWSNYRHYFATKGLGFCYDIEDLISYYGLYTNLMKLWQSQYGNKIYNLDYEKLTNNQERETKRLIKYLGLTWEDSCLSPHKNKRSVRTASQQQVRQKVYKGSSERWRKYAPYLNGAFDSLPP